VKSFDNDCEENRVALRKSNHFVPAWLTDPQF